MMTWLIFIAAEIYRNWYIIEKKKSTPNYLQSFIIRAMAAIIHGAYLDMVYNVFGDVSGYGYWDLIKLLAPVFIFQASLFYTLFDPILNKLRDKPFTHLGKGNWLDRLLQKSDMVYWLLKVAALFLFIVSMDHLRIWI